MTSPSPAPTRAARHGHAPRPGARRLVRLGLDAHAQRHYPFDDPDGLSEAFPADFICEAIDQTRGWFYSLLAVNTLVLDAAPYRNVVCLGHIVDADGQKMSKSKGNIIDPWEIFDTQGADGSVGTSSPPASRGRHVGCSTEGIRESHPPDAAHPLELRQLLHHLRRPGRVGAAADGGRAADVDHVLDRWVLGELDAASRASRPTSRTSTHSGRHRAIAAFVDDLSNWYVRRSRPRFWKDEDPPAHATLHRCLVVTAQLLAPFCPFLADEICTVLAGDRLRPPLRLAEPVQRGRRGGWPSRMAAARRLVALGRAARTDAR